MPNQKRAEAFTAAVAALKQGDWKKVLEVLHSLPNNDSPAQYLIQLAEIYLKHPPKDWHGVIELTQK